MFTIVKTLISYMTARFGMDERGATAVEYGLLVALIALVMAIGASVLGLGIQGLFNDANTELENVG